MTCNGGDTSSCGLRSFSCCCFFLQASFSPSSSSPLFSYLKSMRARVCVCVHLHVHKHTVRAMRGCRGSALMCSSLIIRTLLRPIRHSDCQWKHSIDYVHFIIKPIPIWEEEKAVKQRRIQAANGSRRALSLLTPLVVFSWFFFFSLPTFFSLCQGLDSKCDQSLETQIWNKVLLLLLLWFG